MRAIGPTLVAWVAGCGGAAAPPAREPRPDPLRLTHDDVARRLGPHRFEMRLRTRAWDGAAPDQDREERATLEVAAGGDFHLVHEIGRDDGREAVWVGGVLYTRHRYGAFLTRGGGAETAPKLGEEIWGTLAAQMDAIAHGVDVSQEGGRLVVRAAARPRAPARQPFPEKKWRETVVVESAEGVAALDAGVPVDVTLRATYRFAKEGHAPRVSLEYAHRVVRASPAIAAPEGAIPTPTRRSLEDERKRLLGETK